MLKYPLPNTGGVLEISAGVLETLTRYRQTSGRTLEAGGQLFARFSGRRVILEEATTPGRGDRRTRFSFWPSRLRERREIRSRFLKGLHYVGDWHTHAQNRPEPSELDLESMADCFTKSRHELIEFVLIIVGTVDPPDGLSASLHSGDAVITLTSMDTSDSRSARNEKSGDASVE